MSPFLLSIQKVFLRDLNRLEQEIRQFPNDDSLWVIRGQVKNSAGNLCLHLCGNLQHYIGAVLGKTGYVRNRDAEFSSRHLDTAILLQQIAAARLAIEQTFPQLEEEKMDVDYPEMVTNEPWTTRFFMIHLAAHLSYHLGQVNYLRRLL